MARSSRKSVSERSSLPAPPASVTLARGEAGIACGLLAIAVYVLVMAGRMPQGSLAAPGPGALPTALAVLLGAAAIALLARAWKRRAVDASPVPIGHPLIWITVLALAGVVALLESLGFVLTMSLFLLTLFRAFSGRGWVVCTLGACVTAGLAYTGFRSFLGVALPAGAWW